VKHEPGSLKSALDGLDISDPAGNKPSGIFEMVIEMTRNMFVVLYVVVLIAVVVGVDLLFFRNRFWERLIVNIGIVLVFAAFYLRFLKNP
jgi:type IV secretory pathway VirB2 component (pilin)